MSYIREHGIHVLDNGYFWPVSENDFHDFSKYIFKEYQDLLLSSNDDKLISIGLVETSFINLLVQIFHCNYVKNYAKINNYELTTPDFKEYLYPNWKEIGEQYKNDTFPYSRSVRIIRSLVKYFVFNRKKNCILNIFSRKGKCISIGSSSKLKEKFVYKNNLCCSYYDFPDLFCNDLKSDNNIKLVDKFETEVIDKLFDKVIATNSNFSLNFDFNEAKSSWISRFKDAAGLYDSVKVPKNCKMSVITESAKPYHKIIISSMQNQGVNVYCFHHGHDFAIKAQNIAHQRTVSHCKNFIVPSGDIADQYLNIYSKLPLEKRTNTKYISLDIESYDNHINNSKEQNNSIKSVMIMGYPHNSTRYTDEKGLFSIFKIDLEYRLIRFLKDKGYRVIYKAHPDRLKEVSGVFNDFVDEIVSEPFEDSWKKADAFIFTHTGTTTFGYSLSLGKRVVLINLEKCLFTVDEKHMENLFKVVPAKMDTDNRIQFNKKILLSALT